MTDGQQKGRWILLVLTTFTWIPLRLSRAIGSLLGRLLYTFESRACKVARTNLKLCFPDLEQASREQICRKRMLHIGQTLFETPRLWTKSPSWLNDRILCVDGLQYFTGAVERKKGTMLLVPHQGNWEVVGLWIAQKTTITSLYEPPKLSALEGWIKTSRQNSGATLVPTSSRGVAALLQALRRGETIGILPDQQPPASAGRFAPFFGMPALTMTLIHKLLQRCEAKVVFCTALRIKGGWRVYFTESEPGIYSSDQSESVEALNRGVEKIAGLEPTQYQWEYKRFRKQPEGNASVY